MTSIASPLPVFLHVTNARVIVIGGGAVALRKIERLLRHGAKVVVVAPEVVEGIDSLASAGTIELRRARYDSSMLRGARLVFACTGERAVNHQVATEARDAGALVNVADAADECDFFVPSTMERGVIQIAISTGSASPALTKRLRARLEDLVGDEVADLAETLAAIRRVARPLLEPEQRTELYGRVASDEIIDLFASDADAARARVKAICAEYGLTVPSA